MKLVLPKWLHTEQQKENTKMKEALTNQRQIMKENIKKLEDRMTALNSTVQEAGTKRDPKHGS